MFVATADRPLAATITGSLPRPQWFVENLETSPFLAAYNGSIASASNTATPSPY